jgi:nitrogenase molybdenum-cofactor synthesis protein NifE
MRGTYGLTQIYTGDVSGVCSALYELGGMIVIHDPSGCNSTYNTHDEVRWYDRPAHIFISGFTERDAIFGNDQKLIDDTVEAARTLQPRFITLINSPVPYLVGTDFRAIARLIEKQTGIPAFYVDTNATHDYITGQQGAFTALMEKFLPAEKGEGQAEPRCKCDDGPVRVNILGLSPLDFAAPTAEASLRAWVADQGFELVSCFAMGDSLDDLLKSPSADVNLLVSATGASLARYLRERFGIPTVTGLPVAAFSAPLAQALAAAAQTGQDQFPANDLRQDATGPVSILAGEAVAMTSLAAALSLDGKETRSYRVVCPLEHSGDLLASCDMAVETEDGLRQAFSQTDDLWADPFYGAIAKDGTTLHRLPTLSYSGRVFLSEVPDLLQIDPRDLPQMTTHPGQAIRALEE